MLLLIIRYGKPHTGKLSHHKGPQHLLVVERYFWQESTCYDKSVYYVNGCKLCFCRPAQPGENGQVVPHPMGLLGPLSLCANPPR